MLVKVREEVPVEKVVGKICNKCGKAFSDLGDYHSSLAQVQSLETKFDWGSRFANTSWKFELCDVCLLELVKSFIHVPQGFMGLIHDGMETFTRLDHQALFDTWRATGEWTYGKDDEYGKSQLS